ncbi:DUF2846 domain-containing protein [Pseudoxanthomonas sp. PXM03]|jgi:hypothetical protein|uniref:DUF2846 domain-containing protein n=1 Tax=unclassified Pseudoxanthomonas TaxID=2645906 RepID=UPI00177CC950|nr:MULTISPECIES: DUF2846 domain-containing protein [unclassified Pseudoxanthomonas]MBD9437059.1 DUF2846 domain-containing protein [Pseudoxanthomonas sp. PXM03]WFC41393.1 DUF2846 domain-containing protein [Pseudoxanthomonas sp. SE1]
MRHPLNRSLLCLALLLPMAAGHAQSQEAAAPAATEAPEAAPAPAPAAGDSLIGAPSEGMGQIVFFREKKFAGAAVKYKVREGETELGKLSSGTYFVASVAPGTHQYTVHSEAKDVLTLEVEAGETYYVLGSITMGFMAGRPNLSPSDEAAFNGMAKELKPAKK